jgi:hypothetical protein
VNQHFLQDCSVSLTSLSIDKGIPPFLLHATTYIFQRLTYPCPDTSKNCATYQESLTASIFDKCLRAHEALHFQFALYSSGFCSRFANSWKRECLRRSGDPSSLYRYKDENSESLLLLTKASKCQVFSLSQTVCFTAQNPRKNFGIRVDFGVRSNNNVQNGSISRPMRFTWSPLHLSFSSLDLAKQPFQGTRSSPDGQAFFLFRFPFYQ